MPMGEKLRPKQMDQPITCEISKKCRVRIFMFDQNPLIAKSVLLWGRMFVMEKRESLWHLIKFTLERSLDLPVGDLFSNAIS
jgi:hypothetical protein